MAGLQMEPDPQHLRAIVDMGSNGIRFSISNLAPPTARIMPTLYQNRVGISLYDAQWSAAGERQPIGEDTIAAVLSSFEHFKRTCSDFGVLGEHITVLATEATRTAINSEDFRRRIKDALGWDVTLMPKQEEGRVGAMGIASSLPDVNGLVMDLGGGSIQLSWLVSDGKDGVKTPESGAVSMPYGAAAMSRRLTEAEEADTTATLKEEIMSAVKEAFESLKVPAELLHTTARGTGYTLYLSGGGFRGWGYLLMSQNNVQPYPIPVINGFKALRSQFIGTEEIKRTAAAALQNEDDEVFRVSDRRASQVPAVAFLINVLSKTIPEIIQMRFCQGGVREGYLYSALSKELQSQRPLVVATEPFSRDPSHTIVTLLEDALPLKFLTANYKLDSPFTPDLMNAFANMMYYHSTHSKDLQTSAALRCTTSGVLAGVHGLEHESRAALALLLCSRWGDDVPPVDEGFKKSLEKLIDEPALLWFIRYSGSVAALIAAVYPAGVPEEDVEPRLILEFAWDPTTSHTENLGVKLRVALANDLDRDIVAKEVKSIEKIGKKKNWLGGKGGVGFKIAVVLERLET